MSESASTRKAGTILDGVRHSAQLLSWSRSSKNFCYGAPVITADELDNNALKVFPERDDVRWILDQLDQGHHSDDDEEKQNLVIWKTRQHFATHAVHGSSIWLAAFHPYRSIAYVAQEEQEGKDHIEEKIVGAWERLPGWFKGMYRWSLKAGIFVLEERNGEQHRSFIEPIARGSRKLRSWTYSRIIWDEAAHNDLLKEGYIGAYATVRGAKDPKTGRIKRGQIVMLTSAANHPFLIDLSGAALEPALDMARVA